MPRSAANPRLPLPSRNTLRVAVLAALSAAPVLHAATIPPGTALDASEFLVNSFTLNRQDTPEVARDASGDFVVVWDSYGQASSSSEHDIYAQRYSAAGTPQGNAFLVNTYTSNLQMDPVVAMDASGDFVVVWESYGQASTGSDFDIYARQYKATGTALQASEFRVNTITSGFQEIPSVAMDAVGDFVVTWQGPGSLGSGDDIFARQYNAAGTALQATEFLVNTVTRNNQLAPVVAMDAVGDFVVAWISYDQVNSTSADDVYARQFNSAGTALQASGFLVNTFNNNKQLQPAVAMDASGDFVVTWMSSDQASVSSGYDIYARKYDALGNALQSSEFLVNTFTSGNQTAPTLAIDAAGDFVVTWESYDQPSSLSQYDIYARQYGASGTALQASEFLVNTHTSAGQSNPAVAMDASGDFVMVWQSYISSDSVYDIYARRYQGPETVNLVTTLSTNPSATVDGGSAFDIDLAIDNKTGISNTGDSTIDSALGAATGITAIFTLPPGISMTGAGGTNWACGSVAGTSLTCTYSGSLAAGAATNGMAVNFTAPAGAGTLNFKVAVSSTQQQSSSDSSGDSTSATVTVQAAGTGGTGGGGPSSGGGSSGRGGGSFGLLSLAFLGLPLLRRRRRYER